MFLVAWEWTNTAIAAASIATFAVVFGALLLAAVQLTSIKHNRATEILGGLLNRWNDERLEAARLKMRALDARATWDAIREAQEYNRLDYYILMRIPSFFEEIGIMCLIAKSVPPELVYEFFASAIVSFWGKYEPWIRDVRNDEDDNRFFENFEKLAGEMNTLTKRRDVSPP